MQKFNIKFRIFDKIENQRSFSKSSVIAKTEKDARRLIERKDKSCQITSFKKIG